MLTSSYAKNIYHSQRCNVQHDGCPPQIGQAISRVEELKKVVSNVVDESVFLGIERQAGHVGLHIGNYLFNHYGSSRLKELVALPDEESIFRFINELRDGEKVLN